MRLNGKRTAELMSEKNLTDEAVSQKTGLSVNSLNWIINSGIVSVEAMERIADAIGVEVKEISLPDISGNVENVIEFLKDDDRATVSFSQGRYISKIKKLASERPEECRIVAVNKDGSVCAHIPVSWIKIQPSMQLSDEQRGQRAEAMRQNCLKSRSYPT